MARDSSRNAAYFAGGFGVARDPLTEGAASVPTLPYYARGYVAV
jgi:hypothetical protein